MFKFQDELSGLRKKWNRFCLALHHMKPGMTTQSFGWRAEQSSSAFVDSSGVKQNSRASSSVAKFRRQNSCTIEFSFGTNNQESLKKNLTDELSLDGFKISNDEGVEAKITLALGHSPFPSDDEEEPERSTTMRGLSEKLQENIPWQRGVLPSVVEAMEEFVKRSTRRDTWMLLSGNDVSAKRRLALTVATSLFGSVDNMLKINLKTSKASEAYEELEKALKNGEKNTWETLKGLFILEYSPKGPKWSPVNQLNQVKQGKDSLRDYIAKIKHLNALMNGSATNSSCLDFCWG